MSLSLPQAGTNITISGNSAAIIQVGDSYADLAATVSDSGVGQAGDTNLSYMTFVNGTLVSNIVIDTSQAATDTNDYVATDEFGLTATSIRWSSSKQRQPRVPRQTKSSTHPCALIDAPQLHSY